MIIQNTHIFTILFFILFVPHNIKKMKLKRNYKNISNSIYITNGKDSFIAISHMPTHKTDIL